MIATNRKLSRLPIQIFENLITRPLPAQTISEEEHAAAAAAERLKTTICNRLRKFSIVIKQSSFRNTHYNYHARSTTGSIKTVGQLLRYSKMTLLLALDPILTYEEIGIFLLRVCRQCTPKPKSALEIFQQTLDGTEIIKSVHTMALHQKQQHVQPSQNTVALHNNNNNFSSFGTQIRHIPTGLLPLDDALCGGIRIGTVTEVVGRSGAGKTQFALQLCIMAARWNQGAVYVDTEHKMTLSRLREMGQEWRHRQHSQESTMRDSNNNGEDRVGNTNVFSYNLSGSQSQSQHGGSSDNDHPDAPTNNYIGDYKSDEHFLGNLTIHNPKSTTELLERLALLEDEILQRNHVASEQSNRAATGPNNNNKNQKNGENNHLSQYPVRLLIVDSIAAPMRRDFGSDTAPQRATAIFQCAQVLKRLADQHHLAVVVINQVGSTSLDSSMLEMGSTDGVIMGNSNCSSDPFSASRAALGTSWHHCVTTRLEMDSALTVNSETPESGLEESTVPGASHPEHPFVRSICVRKSGSTPYVTMPFEIATLGVVSSSTRGIDQDTVSPHRL